MRGLILDLKNGRLAASTDGLAVIEFAIIVPLLFLLLGIMEGGLVLAARQELQAAVHDAARAYDGFGTVRRPEPFDDRNANGGWDTGESFTDVNGNGRWDKDQGRNGVGGASLIAVYAASYAWTFFTPLVAGLAGDESGEGLQLTRPAIVQNEPY